MPGDKPQYNHCLIRQYNKIKMHKKHSDSNQTTLKQITNVSYQCCCQINDHVGAADGGNGGGGDEKQNHPDPADVTTDSGDWNVDRGGVDERGGHHDDGRGGGGGESLQKLCLPLLNLRQQAELCHSF